MWLISLADFCVREYCFHAYILTIISQSRFLFYSLLFIINSTSFSQSRLKQKILGSLITIIFSAIIIKTLFQRFYYADTKDTVFF